MHETTARRDRVDPAMVAFALALLGLVFAAGMAVRHFGLFPWTVIADAQRAYKALTKIEPDELFANVIALDPKAPPAPAIRTLDPAAGDEKLLITGGPYENMQACPRHGCLAWIIDRQGRVLRTWEVDFGAVLGKAPGLSGRALTRNFYPVGIALTRDGGIVAAVQVKNSFPYGVGLLKVGPTGAVEWVRWDHNHHWLTVGPDGRIYAPYMTQVPAPERFDDSGVEARCDGKVDDEGIAIYAPDGTLERKVALIPALLKAGWPGLLYSVRDGCDPLHLNSIALVTPEIAARLPGTVAGDMLISLRESSTVAVIGVDGTVRRLIAGRSAGQHGPVFLPDGSVLAFDNHGGKSSEGGSRVVRIDLADGSAATVFPTAASAAVLPFGSDLGGHIDISADGRRAMVVAKEPGRAIEIDVATGKPLWTMENSRDISPYLKMQGIDAKTGNARLKLWGVGYLNDADLAAAGIG